MTAVEQFVGSPDTILSAAERGAPGLAFLAGSSASRERFWVEEFTAYALEARAPAVATVSPVGDCHFARAAP
jgi:hypothetical protein